MHTRVTYEKAVTAGVPEKAAATVGVPEKAAVGKLFIFGSRLL
jgi:hypothetical protein